MASLTNWLSSWLTRLVNPPWYRAPFFVVESLHITRAYYVAAEFGIADQLADGPKSIDELAAAAGANPRSLFRMLRTLAAFGVFAQDREGRFKMTRRARCLLSEGPQSLRAWFIFMGRRELWQGFACTLESVKQGVPPFELAHGMGYYEYLNAHPELGAVFGRALSNWTAWHAGAVVRAFNFSRFNTVCDVGGGAGSFLEVVLKANPKVRGILFEQPDMIRLAEPRFAEAGLQDRVTLVGGSFEDGIPTGADAYVLKHVLYDWDNPAAARVLEYCHRAMSDNATLLVIEGQINPSNGVDRITKMLDLEMGSLLRGGPRTEDENRELLASVGFSLARVHRTAVADVMVLEAVKVPATIHAGVDGAAKSPHFAETRRDAPALTNIK